MDAFESPYLHLLLPPLPLGEERGEGRRSKFTLTLALSRKRARVIIGGANEDELAGWNIETDVHDNSILGLEK